MEAKTLDKITVPAEHNPLLQQALENVNNNEELLTLWKCINVNAITRLRMSDHGIVHFQIVANMGLKIARLLEHRDIDLSIVKDHGLTQHHGELVIFLASLMHDLGMTINREGHEGYSLVVANRLLPQILDFLPTDERVRVTADTLHAIISHRKGGTPYTLEAGIVRVADALDMTHGRAREVHEAGEVEIYSLSVVAIDDIEITEGDERPVQVNITMNNSIGLFQVDELLSKKLSGSGIEKHVEVKAFIEGESEKKLLQEFKIRK